ncbi:kinase-like protein [Morchella conica CCBAS932]|uniref:Kinase-like protein n=1 Tax=Morchella conica CCBAS932 TaxID=1392247 RepID=A0A3N4KAZ1_9PEZI|nr:kinase-like protein [Morchella conica CCBAS932]RPB10756.1 kinase-like protein [Morchella conica CCBAS932]
MTDPLLRPFDKERLPTIRRHGYWRQPVPGSEANNTELQYEDWRNEKILGRGTYGTVRLVRSAQDEKKMRAVKEVFKINTPTALASRELQALIALQKHPEHFVKFFGWWEDDECFYFAMEYIEKGDLMSLLKDNKLTEMDARTIAKQILEGLQTMHQNHICHRDVKPDVRPSNILAISWLPGPLRVKLTDFGCAKFGAGTGLRTTIGTVGYMAPEVLGYDDDQETSNYTYEADIWSLGCVIYYVMTRKLPLVGFRSYMKYIRGQIPLPSEKLIQNGVSQSGIDFISMLMSPDRDKRPSAKMALQHEWLYAVTAEKKCMCWEVYSSFLFISPYFDKCAHR